MTKLGGLDDALLALLMQRELAQQRSGGAGPKAYTASDAEIDRILAEVSGRPKRPTAEPMSDYGDVNMPEDPKAFEREVKAGIPKVERPTAFQPGPVIMHTEKAGDIDRLLRRFAPSPEVFAGLKDVSSGPTLSVAEWMKEKKIPLDQYANTALLGRMTVKGHQEPGRMYLNPRLTDESDPHMLGQGETLKAVLLHELSHAAGTEEYDARDVGRAAETPGYDAEQRYTDLMRALVEQYNRENKKKGQKR